MYSQSENNLFSFSLRDTLVSFGILFAATALCAILRLFDTSNDYVSMLFILSVFLISRYTNGYFYGGVASLVSVLMVNYIFTYPYMEFNFTLAGYPLTILCALAVSIITSTLTTQIKQQERIRSEAEREKMRGNLLRAVSHDLRTPLTSILGAISVVTENDDMLSSEERKKLLSGAKDDAQWLIRMVENLLTITRIDRDRTTQITKEHELAEELVAESIAKFQKRFPDQQVSVSVPEEPLEVPMDAILIQQVLINLLENSVIHSNRPVDISLSVETRDNFAVFTVSDNGQGIPENILPHIFDGYLSFNNHESNADTKRNMGIGLSVCNTIIRAHSGSMTAANAPSGGAIFTFSLPL